jgi:hypothetical protein
MAEMATVLHYQKDKTRLRRMTYVVYAGFCERLMYATLAGNLRAGRATTAFNGKIITDDEVRAQVAYARAQGWLPQ